MLLHELQWHWKINANLSLKYRINKLFCRWWTKELKWKKYLFNYFILFWHFFVWYFLSAAFLCFKIKKIRGVLAALLLLFMQVNKLTRIKYTLITFFLLNYRTILKGLTHLLATFLIVCCWTKIVHFFSITRWKTITAINFYWKPLLGCQHVQN